MTAGGLRAPSPEELLQIARNTGLRGLLHGVSAVEAREALASFMDEVLARVQVEAPAPVAAVPAPVPTIDLLQLFWEQIQQAARESKWIPREYFMNDWVSDVSGWLRDGPPQADVPDGWQLVPTAITEAMHVGAVRTIVNCTGNDDFPPRVWRAMLAKAPQYDHRTAPAPAKADAPSESRQDDRPTA